jgi:methionyl aminopeptidase
MKYQPKKIGRNDPCPCGSGEKYKKCCLHKEKKIPETLSGLYLQKHGIRLKNEEDVEKIAEAGKLVIATLDMIESKIRPGITTDYLNTLVHEFTVEHNAIPAPLHYEGFPKSVCTSVNDVICHGIPSKQILKDSDIINIDVTSILDGYYADANKTFFVGSHTLESEKIVTVARNSLKIGLHMVKPGNHIGDIGWAIQKYAEGQGCSVVRDFVGHGVGFDFHEYPQVPHYGRKGEGVEMIPGMVFTIEPMINLGSHKLHILDDGWTAVTADGSLSAQFEQTVLVTEHGYESLTPYPL